MSARFLPSLLGTGHLFWEPNSVWFSFPSPSQLRYSQVHFLPGEWVGKVLHPVVTVLWNSGLQGRAQLLQNLIELLCDAAFWSDFIHLWRAKSQIWEEATSSTQRKVTSTQSCTGSRSPGGDHAGERRLGETRNSVLPFLHCSHKDVGSGPPLTVQMEVTNVKK